MLDLSGWVGHTINCRCFSAMYEISCSPATDGNITIGLTADWLAVERLSLNPRGEWSGYSWTCTQQSTMPCAQILLP